VYGTAFNHSALNHAALNDAALNDLGRAVLNHSALNGAALNDLANWCSVELSRPSPRLHIACTECDYTNG